LLDRSGVIRYIGIGAGAEESENLEEMIEKLLAESNQKTCSLNMNHDTRAIRAGEELNEANLAQFLRKTFALRNRAKSQFRSFRQAVRI
jgi:hypothetical protein